MRAGGILSNMAEHEPVRVLLVDDHRVLLDSLAAAFDAQDDLAVVGTASTIDDALALGARTSPDLVLLDLRMDGDDAVASIPRFRALS